MRGARRSNISEGEGGGGMAVHCPKIAIAGPGGSQISDIKDTSSSVCPRSLQPESRIEH